MLKFAEFDIKTGRPILEYDPNTGGQTQSYKEVSASYLEHWLKARGYIHAPLYTAEFYQGINPSDNERLLKQGKHVIFTGGTSGKYVSAYFTDAATAIAILIGNDRDRPLYELGAKSAHYAVAYGSLPISDCYKDVVVKGGKGRKILIVDDEAQSVGSNPITDRDGKPVEDLSDLLSKMGDGTMLVPTGLMRELLLEKEVQTIIRRGIERTDRDLNEELGVVGEWLDEVTGDKVEDELVAVIAAEYRANGRIGTSHVHLNAAKTINKLLDKAADESVIQFRSAITDTPGMFKGMMKTSSWCERLGMSAIVSKNCIKGNGVDLDTEALRTSWIDAATSGVEVPSAVAQHHGKLDVWEVCNQRLPHGAVVAFYRSPLPNVSAVAMGVNNLDLKNIDPESYHKRGVVYVNPWTAKEVAISDFDGDRFGQFVGYVAKDPDLFIAQMRDVVAAYESPSGRYEAFHAAIEQSIELGTDLEPGTFPLAVEELAVATSKENRPQQIKKAVKIAHEWKRQDNQPISEAIFTAWTNVAANPISKVANLGMNLQMLAQNAKNTPDPKKPALLKQVAFAFEKLDNIPSDKYLIRAC